MFCSSIGGINKKQSEETLYSIKTSTPANSKSVAYCSGSELYIDDIELIY